MSKLTRICLATALLLTCRVGLLAQEKKTGPSQEEMQAMMAEVMKYAAPGEHHKHIGVLEGNWNLKMRFHMAPDAPWEENAGQSEHKWVLGGRFLQMDVSTPPTATMPVEFNGLGLLGYDNFAQEYVQMWMDNFGTGVITTRGSCSESGKEITLEGQHTKPISGGQTIDLRWVYNIANADEFTFEMWEPDANGEMYLHGEIIYTRVK